MFSKQEEVYQIVQQIPKGKVVTYGDIAKAVGANPRWIGRTLHNNPHPEKVPCQRVVRSDGRLATAFAFGGMEEQKKMLLAEGVIFKGEKVDMRKCQQ